MRKDIQAENGERVAPDLIAEAVTAAALSYGDGASQTFDVAGNTTYVEQGRPTRGEWYVDEDGRFCSFWPPSYRAWYDLRWIVDGAEIVGLRFVELGRARASTAVIAEADPALCAESAARSGRRPRGGRCFGGRAALLPGKAALNRDSGIRHLDASKSHNHIQS